MDYIILMHITINLMNQSVSSLWRNITIVTDKQWAAGDIAPGS